jgi:excisionase family DNA binding protein
MNMNPQIATTHSHTTTGQPPITVPSTVTGRGQILTVAEVALELRCSKAHVYNVIAGKVDGVRALPAISMGRRKLVRRASLEDWMETNETAAQRC